MKQGKRRRIIRWVVLLAIVAVILWIVWSNVALSVHELTITDDGLPSSFVGFRIAQVSDLHNATFGKDNERLIEKLRECKPDIIVLTGDLIDSYHTDIGVGIAFAQKAVEIAPTYFVTGNHEARIGQYDELIDGLTSSGVTVLQNESVVLSRGNDTLTLLGVCDPSFQTDYLIGAEESVMNSVLSDLMRQASGYTVLLSHRPELFDVYVSSHVDLVFSGHAHGGQFRLPFVGGLVAPGQGLFPQYDAGLYTENQTNMIVSRGLGNSLFPFRVNNAPEIVVAELQQ